MTTSKTIIKVLENGDVYFAINDVNKKKDFKDAINYAKFLILQLKRNYKDDGVHFVYTHIVDDTKTTRLLKFKSEDGFIAEMKINEMLLKNIHEEVLKFIVMKRPRSKRLSKSIIDDYTKNWIKWGKVKGNEQ